MRKIGIVPSAQLNKSDDIYGDYYRFVNSYIERVAETGNLPIGILPVNGRIRTSILEECDAFIIQGGSGIYGYHIDVMDYCVKNSKKVLGICLGMQTVHTYFAVIEEAAAAGFHGDPAEFYLKRLAEGKRYLGDVSWHRAPSVPRGDKNGIKHKVILEEGTHIYRLLGKREIYGASLHSNCVTTPATGEIVSGRAEDGTVEAVEIGENIIGTQFHPDVDRELKELFDWVTE